ncbi:universal stress protein [Candidatus Leptofilum sp.]|uniref:universal stress protein n=1 Tax=Candidatus Leptofilum sp. TaxID=3241576 RepID=UPI003B591A37
MFNHLLVPLDGSELAEAALPLATAVAKKFGSRITLVSAVHLPYYVGDGLDFAEVYGDISQNMEDEAKTYLQAKQRELITAGFHVDIEIVIGQPPAEAILQTAVNKVADTIVMSTHGRGGVMRWVFGSVADKVLRNADVPILLARAPSKSPSNAAEPALENILGQP